MSTASDQPAAASGEPGAFCPQCGYDLRGSVASGRCPECGLAVDAAALAAASRIPWVHRAAIGRWRAFWRTAWWATARPRELAAESVRPVRFADAVLFRRQVVWAAWTPLAMCAVAAYAYFAANEYDVRSLRLDVAAATLEVVGVGVALAALWLWLLLACGAASYLFHPGYLPVERQNRAVALSYYACAPVAWTPLVMLVAAAAFAAAAGAGLRDPIAAAPMTLAVVAAAAVQGVSLLRMPLVVLRRTTQCGPGRAAALLVGLPLAWAVLFAVVVGGIVGTYVLAATVLLTIR